MKTTCLGTHFLIVKVFTKQLVTWWIGKFIHYVDITEPSVVCRWSYGWYHKGAWRQTWRSGLSTSMATRDVSGTSSGTPLLRTSCWVQATTTGSVSSHDFQCDSVSPHGYHGCWCHHMTVSVTVWLSVSPVGCCHHMIVSGTVSQSGSLHDCQCRYTTIGVICHLLSMSLPYNNYVLLHDSRCIWHSDVQSAVAL